MSIRTVQERLIQYGQNIQADGVWGPRTQAALDAVLPPKVEAFSGEITAKVAMELLHHEAIVQEAYKDSVGVWTWGVGVTDASGHLVGRYKDNPQPIARCLEVFVWLLRRKYGPEVQEAFVGHDLTEAQFSAALSFHYNTGAIGRASWVKTFLAGDSAKAAAQFMEWRRPPEIIKRRQAECDLFFHGKWAQDGTTTVWPVRKPSYTPDWRNGRKVNVTGDLQAALG
jgi:GH24 family phage-related lysozyme (muramidase)